MNRYEQEWANAFHGKDEAEILTVPLPPDLTGDQCFRFRLLQREAADNARQSKENAKDEPLLQAAEDELAIADVGADPAFAEPEGGKRAPPLPTLPFAIPTGSTDKLLDKQIASCAGIIEHLAHFIARYDSAVETCNQFMDRISLMMRSSAEVAIAAGRLRGIAPEGRRRR